MKKFEFETLKQTEFFATLDHQALEAISSVCEIIHYPKNKIICFSGDKSSHIYIIISGWVKIYKNSLIGKDSIINILGQLQIFGDSSCLAQGYHASSVQAISDVRILKIPQKELLQAIKIDSDYSAKIAKWMFLKQKALINKIEQNNLLSAEGRLANHLLFLSQKQKSNVIILPYKKALLAEYLNTTPETLSRTLKSFNKKNIIEFKNKVIKLVNKDYLQDLSHV